MEIQPLSIPQSLTLPKETIQKLSPAQVPVANDDKVEPPMISDFGCKLDVNG